MASHEIEFSKDDCWILFSIPQHKHGGSLSEIIELSDVLNHAVPNEQELQIALTKGIQAGLVKQRDDRFYATSILWDLKQKILKGKGGLFTLTENLYNQLKKFEFNKLNEQQVLFKPLTYQHAFEDYSHRFWWACKSLW